MEITTPESCDDFSTNWVQSVTKEYFVMENIKDARVLSVSAKDNELQGILSKTFVLDIEYRGLEVDDDGEEKEETKERSIFVKVPLKDPNFVSVNVRELVMLKEVLPKLQCFVDKNCIDIIQLPFPEVIHAYYDGKGISDVFVLGNLLSDGFENLNEKQDLNEEHLYSCLDCLSQLHGTGMSFKQTLGSGTRKDFLREFPKLEEQIQLQDLLDNDELKSYFRRCYKPFLHFLEAKEPNLKSHTIYMKKFGRFILKIIQVLEKSGYEKLLTLCHGDAKPNNFLFRRHIIDIEELECEGLEAILIDWQGGFLGSIANDLMWVIYPFIEAANLRGESGRELRDNAFKYYFEALQSVLTSFNLTLTDLELPESFEEFNKILQKSLVLEFLLVTVVKPIMALKEPAKLISWYKILDRNEKKGYKRHAEEPNINNIFSSERFPSFCLLYFKIATVLGGFQELGRIFFDVMKDSMFDEGHKADDSDEEDDEGYISRVINLSIKHWVPITVAFVAIFGIVLSLFLMYF
uniref:CHK kinase-like domain-containing protein n=1 Tax=Lepeophtheirus salmonis TaxID=72036 RepID=A0A0K2T6X4_LEPSM